MSQDAHEQPNASGDLDSESKINSSLDARPGAACVASVLSSKFIELVFAHQILQGNARVNSRGEFRWFLWRGL